MSNYYQYKFVSPDPLYARVKEEMRTYFASGAVDDLMFSVYLRDALRKLSGKGTKPVKHTMLFIDCFAAKLPPSFGGVRECWLMTNTFPAAVRVPGAYYEAITTILNKPYDACNPVNNCDPCNPDIVQVVQKTNEYYSPAPFRMKYLLTPGDDFTREMCGMGSGSLNLRMTDTSKFHLERGKITTEFREGDIYLKYYADEEDCEGNQLIPENYRIEQFILAYLKAKLYEFLWNTDSGETFNQSLKKYEMYQQMADEAYILADIEMKKQTMEKKAYNIYRDTHRNNIYERTLDNRGRRTNWRGINNRF